MEIEFEEHETSKKDFEYFKVCCKRWQDILHLGGWNIFVDHDADESSTLAWTNFVVNNRTSTIVLNKIWKDEKPTKKQLSRTAFHETVEVMLARTTDALLVYLARDIVMEITHETIRTLERVIWEPDWNKRRK